MIEIKNVSKSYNGKTKALDNVSFKVPNGKIFAFIGHNGAGKTTLIKMIMGILDFDEGDILVEGKSIKENPIECKKVIWQTDTANKKINRHRNGQGKGAQVWQQRDDISVKEGASFVKSQKARHATDHSKKEQRYQ